LTMDILLYRNVVIQFPQHESQAVPISYVILQFPVHCTESTSSTNVMQYTHLLYLVPACANVN